jgi:hypothetical protein
MSDNRELRQKLGLVSATSPLPSETEDESEAKCYQFLRGVRERALNLEFRRLKEGDSIAFPYSWLGVARYDPSLGILLVFSAGELFGVRIRGRHLNEEFEKGISLFDRGLLRHRITCIREMSEQECGSAGERECVVQRIEIAPLPANNVMQFLGLA